MATMRVKKTRRPQKANRLLVVDQHRVVAQIHVTVPLLLRCADDAHTQGHQHPRLPLVEVATIPQTMVDIHPDVDLIVDVHLIVIAIAGVLHPVVVDVIVMVDPDPVPAATHLQGAVAVVE